MRATLSEFQEKLPEMRDLAARGESVLIEEGNHTYEFRLVPEAPIPIPRFETTAEFINFMKGRLDLSNFEEDGPIIPIEEWGDLA